MVWTMYPLVEQCVYLISAAIYGGPTLWVLYCTTAAVTWIYRWTIPKDGIVPPSLALYIVPCSTVEPLPRVALYLLPLYQGWQVAVLSSSGFVIPDLSRIYCHGPLASSDSIFLSTQTNLREFWIIFFCKVSSRLFQPLLACLLLAFSPSFSKWL